MYGLYTPILFLQAFCLYHAYKNGHEQKWYWLILFFPGIGCFIYLYSNFSTKTNINSLTEGVKEVVNSNYKIQQLEKELKFSETVSNKTNLADAYMKIGRYKDASLLYADCLKGFMSDDPVLLMKLLQAHFLNEDYKSAIECGDKLKKEHTFRNADERIAYAWALHYEGKTDLAIQHFNEMDKSYTNYKHRVEYCKFLIERDQKEEAKSKLNELLDEFNHMKTPERRFKKVIIREVKELCNALERPVKKDEANIK